MAQTFESSSTNISFEYPLPEERPINRQTFMLVGFGVTLDAEPTTSEEMLLSFVKSGDYPSELEVVKRDLSNPAVTNWLHLLNQGPVPLPQDTIARVVYPNTDENEVNITLLGYWR